MSKEDSSSRSGGIGILSVLGIVFVTLKLCGLINWSWWYVTMPFWGGIALCLTIIAILFLVAGMAAVISRISK